MVEHQSTECPEAEARELGLLALTSDGTSDDLLRGLCEDAIASLPNEADVVRRGNERVLNKLVGFVMKKSKGTVDAQTTRECLRELLLGSKSQ